MKSPSATTPLASDASPNLPSRGRLVFLAVLLPTFVAATNQAAFKLAAHPGMQLWLYPWMVLTTAALSYCVGRYLNPTWFRWLLFAWCLVLIDMLTMANSWGSYEGHVFSYVLLSAQINLLMFWAVVGPSKWQIRLPAALVGGALLLFLASALGEYWTSQGWYFSLLIAATVGGGVCVGLRQLGFRLRNEQQLTSRADGEPERTARQFGLRHMFVWATAIVPLLLAIRAIELSYFMPQLDSESIFAAALLAASIASVNLISIWCVLGSGRWFVRLGCLLIIPCLIAAGVGFYSKHLESLYGRWPNLPVLDAMISMNGHWHTWFWLSAALLAALLLFLRAQGYRLARH